MSSLLDSQPVATQPATYHAEDDDSDEEEDEEQPKTWGRLFPLTPDFDTVGSYPRSSTQQEKTNR